MLISTILDGQLENNRGNKGLLKALQGSFSRNVSVITPKTLAKLLATIAAEKDSVGEDDDCDHSSGSNGACPINTPFTSKPFCSTDHASPGEVSKKSCAHSGPSRDI